MSEESGFYYWDILTEKFNITKESGHGAAQRALKSWFRREEEADLRRFDVTVLQGVPTEVEIEIVRPLAAYDARENIIDWALAIAKATAEQYTSDQAILNSELIRLGIRSAT